MNKLILITLALVFASSLALAKKQLSPAEEAQEAIYKKDQILQSLEKGVQYAQRDRNGAIFDIGLRGLAAYMGGGMMYKLYTNRAVTQEGFPKMNVTENGVRVALPRTTALLQAAYDASPSLNATTRVIGGLNRALYSPYLFAGVSVTTVILVATLGDDAYRIYVDYKNLGKFAQAIGEQRAKLQTAAANNAAASN